MGVLWAPSALVHRSLWLVTSIDPKSPHVEVLGRNPSRDSGTNHSTIEGRAIRDRVNKVLRTFKPPLAFPNRLLLPNPHQGQGASQRRVYAPRGAPYQLSSVLWSTIGEIEDESSEPPFLAVVVGTRMVLVSVSHNADSLHVERRAKSFTDTDQSSEKRKHFWA